MTRLPKVFVKISFLLIALFALPLMARAQEVMPAPSFTQAQIDQMVAPIALYPDPLIAQIMMAATYPLEVVEAGRWLQDTQNAQLQGSLLTDALEEQSWDPSVKSLVAFPQVLSMMNDNLQWTEQLGNAFLAQQDTVMDSVQRLRRLAQSSGHLASTPQQTVSYDSGVIVIEPANPQVVYVPYYVPTAVYGPWPYPAYPPYYFPQPGLYYNRVGLIGFGIGIAVIDWLWDWDSWDWHRHRIDIDDRRFARLNHGFSPPVSGVWRHEPEHRHNVPYSNPAVRAQFQNGADQARGNFRGYPVAPFPQKNEEPNRGVRQNTALHEMNTVQRAPKPFVNDQQPRHEMQPPLAIQQQSRQETHMRPEMQRQPQQKMLMPPVVQQFRQEQRAPVFDPYSRGAEVRIQSQRGADSRSAPVSAGLLRGPSPARDQGHDRHKGDERDQNRGGR